MAENDAYAAWSDPIDFVADATVASGCLQAGCQQDNVAGFTKFSCNADIAIWCDDEAQRQRY